jgi:hypothetical protein
MAAEEPKTMSAVGERIWLYMQEHEPPYNRSTLSRRWKREGTFPVTPQAISNYLYRKHPPPDFVNAIVRTFDLSREQEVELHWLYFHGRERQLP